MPKLGGEEATIFVKHFGTFLAFSFLGWLVSWWNLSLVGVGFICALYSWKVTFDKAKRAQRKKTKHFFKNEKAAIQELFEEVPRWVFFPDIERVEWINKMVVQIWPCITQYVCEFLKENLEPKIQQSLPSQLKSFKFDRLDLGDQPPRITGVKVYSHHTHEEEIVADFDIFYAGDATVSIKISRLEAGVKDLQVKGTLRVVLKPLLRHPPFLGGIQLYFLTNPMLNFELTDIARVFEVPGLQELLEKILLTQLSNYLVLPNKLTIALSHAVDLSQLRYVDPKGVMLFRLKEAKDLVSHDIASKSDPYAQVSVSTEQFSSTVMKNTHNPVWEDEVYHFTVLEIDGVNLELRVLDDDDTSKDDVIGSHALPISIPLSGIVKEGHIDTWKDLPDDEGSVHFACTWYGLSSSPPASALPGTEITGSTRQPTVLLSVYVDSAKYLQKEDGATEEPSTMVKVIVGTEVKNTRSVMVTPNPVYQDNFHFLLAHAFLDTLRLKVCDVDSDDVFGTVSVPLSKVLSATSMTTYQHHVLTGGAGVSEILVRVSAKYLELSTNDEVEATEETIVDVGTTSDIAADKVDPLAKVDSEAVDRPKTADVDTEVALPPKSTDVDTDVVISSKPSKETNEGAELRQRKPIGRDTNGNVSESRRRSSAAVERYREVKAGDIELTVVYKKSESKLIISVHRCRELTLERKGNGAAGAPNTYVKFYLMPDRTDKHKTDTCKDSSYPVFEETFDFDVSRSDLTSMSLEVTAKHKESLFSKIEIGECTIPLFTVPIDRPETKWYPLNRKVAEKSSA